jgi:hypothetical protein
MLSMDRKILEQPVTIEYIAHGQRIQKTLQNAHAAKAFYVAKAKQGRQPAVIKGL